MSWTRSTSTPNANQPNSEPDWFEQLVNSIFAMRQSAGSIRISLILILFVLLWIFLSFYLHPWTWETLNEILLSATTTDPVTAAIVKLIETFFARDVIGHLIALILPFWIALLLASLYLTDIFELRNPQIARRFITQAAFSAPRLLELHLEEGAVRRADRDLPIVQIGGPGRVRINLENAAVFDRVDGSCKIIGPTFGLPNSVHLLEGFERLRQVIDLRDQTSAFDVYGRTRDGIRIAIQDVRLIFSIRRNTSDQRQGQTYTFTHSAVYDLVYRQGYQQTITPWTNAMTGLVRSELTNFISEHTLGELMAAVEDDTIKRQVEIENSKRRYLSKLHRYGFLFKSRGVIYPPPPLLVKKNRVATPYLKKKHKKAPVRFQPKIIARLRPQSYAPRAQLSRMFYSTFARGFTHRARQRGVRLEWINVGTWHPMAEIIPNQHIEAFQITVENSTRGNARVLDTLKKQAQTEEIIRLLRQTPIYSFLRFRSTISDEDELIYQMINDYMGKLRSAIRIYKDQGRVAPPELSQAIQVIDQYQRGYSIRRFGRVI